MANKNTYLIELSKLNLDLSVYEFQSLFGDKNLNKIENYVLVKENIEKKINLLRRLSYLKNAYLIHKIFSFKFNIINNTKKKTDQNNDNFQQEMQDKINSISAKITKEFNFNNLIKKKYKLFYEHIPYELQIRINDSVWRSLKKPKVDLKDPEQKLYFIGIKNKIYLCSKIYENKNDFNNRLPHKRKFLKPISLHPRLALCLVNLTGCRKGKVVDPFTGTSGILIEALLSGLKVEGYDINEEMLKISEINFKELGFNKKDYILQKKDFFSIKKRIRYIVTDLPYGKNTKNLNNQFYKKAIIKLNSIIGKKAVVVFPDWINVKKLIKENLKIKNLKLEKEFMYYIHKSMSKRICIFSKK